MDARVYVRPCRGGLMFGAYEPDPLDGRSARAGRLASRSAISTFDIEPLRRAMAEVRDEFPLLEDAEVAELRGGLPTMTPDGHFIVDRLPGVEGLYVANGLQRRRPVDLAPDRRRPRRLDRRRAVSGRGRLEPLRIDRFDDRYANDEELA